jgi:hypothetical protein
MIDYSKWQKDNVKVSNLLLDYQNPRFSHKKEHLSQNELINEMVKKYAVYDLAKSIAYDGYFPDKSLVTISENSKLLVIEGNRRLSALKCLINPDIIAGKEKDKFTKLNNYIDRDYIKTIAVVTAPSREAANPIIFKEHTGNTAMPWSRIMQAEFYMRQINNGISIDELEQEYHRPKSEINKFLKLHYMYNIARNISYDNKAIQAKVNDKQDFPASVLERIYDSSVMKDYLGISFDNHGNITGEKAKEAFTEAYRRIVTDIVEKKVDTRTLNKEDDFKKYAITLEGIRPQKKGSFTYDDFAKEEVEIEAPEPTEKSLKRSVRKSSGIIPAGLPFSLKGASNLHKNYDELRRLPVKTYANTTAVMLRTFLDKSLRMYLKKCHVPRIPIQEDGSIKHKKISDASLGEILEYLISKEANIIDDDNVIKTIKKFKSSGDPSVSLSGLNAATHNEEFSLTETEVRNI